MPSHGLHLFQAMCFVLLTGQSVEKALKVESRVTVWELEFVSLTLARSLSVSPCRVDDRIVVLPPISLSTRYAISDRHSGNVRMSIGRPEVDCSNGGLVFENGDSSNRMTISVTSEKSCLSEDELRLCINIDTKDDSKTAAFFHTSVYSEQASSEWEKQLLREDTGKAILQLKWRVSCGPNMEDNRHRVMRRQVPNDIPSNDTNSTDDDFQNTTASNGENTTNTTNTTTNTTNTTTNTTNTTTNTTNTTTADPQSPATPNVTRGTSFDDTTIDPVNSTSESTESQHSAEPQVNSSGISDIFGFTSTPSGNDSVTTNTSKVSSGLFSLISSLLQSTKPVTLPRIEESSESSKVNRPTTAEVPSPTTAQGATETNKQNHSELSAPAAGEDNSTDKLPPSANDKPIASSSVVLDGITTLSKVTEKHTSTSTAKTTTRRSGRPGDRTLPTLPPMTKRTTPPKAPTSPTTTVSPTAAAIATSTTRPTTKAASQSGATTSINNPDSKTIRTDTTSKELTDRPLTPRERPQPAVPPKPTPTTKSTTTTTVTPSKPGPPTHGQTTVPPTTRRKPVRPSDRPAPSTRKPTTKSTEKPLRPWEISTSSTKKPVATNVPPTSTKKDVIFTAAKPTPTYPETSHEPYIGNTDDISSSELVNQKPSQITDTDSGPDEDMVWPIVLGLVIGIPTIIVLAIAITVVQKKHFGGLPSRHLSSPGYFERRPPPVPFVSRPTPSPTCNLEKPPKGIEV